jgi:hypothetical protein
MSSWHGGKGSGRRKEDLRKFEDNYDAIFRNKNQKHKQQDMTELNGDGNRARGRYGEDLSVLLAWATGDETENN